MIPPYVLALAQDLDCNVFIESGTFHGDTYHRAIESGYFECVYTTEVAEHFYRSAYELYPHGAYWGKSYAVFQSDIFPLCKPDDRIFFWLDGHYCGAGSGGQDELCPLLKELEAIREWCPTKAIVIAIDDVKNFGRQSKTPGFAWPTKDQIMLAAFRIRRDFAVLELALRRGILLFAYREPSGAWKGKCP